MKTICITSILLLSATLCFGQETVKASKSNSPVKQQAVAASPDTTAVIQNAIPITTHKSETPVHIELHAVPENQKQQKTTQPK